LPSDAQLDLRVILAIAKGAGKAIIHVWLPPEFPKMMQRG
jgi:hypothetical protein